MAKVLVQLCIYFCVVGFVVHAQSPLNTNQHDALAELLRNLEDLRVLEQELAAINKEMEKNRTEYDQIAATAPNPLWARIKPSRIFGEYDAEDKKKLEKMHDLNVDFKKLHERRMKLEPEILGKQLTIQDLNNTTFKWPEERVRAILRDKNIGDASVVDTSRNSK